MMRTFWPFSPAPLLTLVLLSSLRLSGQAAPAPQDVLARPASIEDQSLPAFSAFQGALQVSGVPGGIAFVEGCSDQPEAMVHAHGTTLREVLDSITSGPRPRYVWRMNNGAVNLEPSKGVPALLRTRLKTYDLPDTDAVSAVTLLSSLPEVTRSAAGLGLTHNVMGPGLGGIAQSPLPRKKPLILGLHNVTLLAALNAIARANTHGVWVYRENHCGSIRQFNLSFAQ